MTASKTLEFIAGIGERTIVTRRDVDARCAVVFDAWTKPEHLERWWGSYVLAMVVCEVDLRVGGRWRFVQRSREGHDFEFRGEYKEIVLPERLVYSFVFDGMPFDEAVETVMFDEHDGQTTIRSTTLHETVEARDLHVAWPLLPGLMDAYERLDDLLAARRL